MSPGNHRNRDLFSLWFPCTFLAFFSCSFLSGQFWYFRSFLQARTRGKRVEICFLVVKAGHEDPGILRESDGGVGEMSLKVG